jgi:hypothetical protein
MVTPVDRAQVESTLTECEAGAVDPAPFWRAVNAVKANPGWVRELAGRIGMIDRRLFEDWAAVKVPVAAGTALMVVGTAIGLGLIGYAYYLDGVLQGVLLLAGTVALLVTTHGLAHLVVGALQGMRFTHWFIGSWRRPQPGVKVDYTTYLMVPAGRRAWMHAAGAITTKLIPVVGLGAGWAMGAPGWVMAVLAVLTAGQVVTDVAWSTKSSDWAKFSREHRFAQAAAQGGSNR